MTEKGGTGIVVDRDPARTGDKPAYVATEKQKKLIKAVEDAGAKLRRHKEPIEKMAFANLAALMGQYWLQWNSVARSYDIPLRGPGEGIRLTINLMLPLWRRIVARLTAHPPAIHVAPATTDEEDAEIARFASRVIDGEMERLNYPAIRKRFIGWMIATGTVYVRVRWDPFAGPLMWDERPVMDPMTGMPAADPMTGEPMTERVPLMDEHGKQVNLGDSVIEVYNLFEAGSDPNYEESDESPWWYFESIKSLEWIKTQYPKYGKYVLEETDLFGNSTYEKLTRQIAGVFGQLSGEGEDSQGPVAESARVREWLQKPTLEYPEGRSVVVANKVLLHDGVNPDHEQVKNGIPYPIGKAVEIRIPGRAWGTSTIEHGLPLNKALNRRRSQEEENTAVCGRPKVIIPHGSNVPEGSFNGKAGEKITYRVAPNGAKPEYMSPPTMAAATDTAIRHLMADLQEVTSSHDATIGRMPSANAPAEAIRLLQIGDETSVGETNGNAIMLDTRVSKMLLCNAMQYWTEERMVRVTGEDHAIIAEKIAGMQLKGAHEGNYCDVRIMPQSTMWRDPKAQREQVDWLVERGILNPMLHKREILKAIDLGSLDSVMRDERQDESWANRENEFMEQAQPMEPRDFEDHQVHIRTHNRYRKSERYRKLPPELQMIFDQHVMMHEQHAVMVAQKQMAAGMAVHESAMQDPNGENPDTAGSPGEDANSSGAPEPTPQQQAA